MELGVTFWIKFHAHRIWTVSQCTGDTLLWFLYYLNHATATLVLLFDTTMCFMYTVFMPFKIPFVALIPFNEAGQWVLCTYNTSVVFIIYTMTRFIPQNIGYLTHNNHFVTFIHKRKKNHFVIVFRILIKSFMNGICHSIKQNKTIRTTKPKLFWFIAWK